MGALSSTQDAIHTTQSTAAGSALARISRVEISVHGEAIEDVDCPLCGSGKRTTVYNASDILYGKPGTYPVVRCQSCTLSYVSPRPTPEALGAHYPRDYISYSSSDDSPALARPFIRQLERSTSQRRIRLIERARGRILPETQIVDVGCGLNQLLEEVLRVRGAVGQGVDMDETMVQRALRRGMPVTQSTFSEAKLETGRYDLVTMMEYLEHDPWPLSTLREARRVLRPGGHLAIEIPHVDGLPARFFKQHWANLDAPRHLVFFDRTTLRRALREQGFELESFTTFGIPFFVGMSMLFSMGWHGRMRQLTATQALAVMLGAPFVPALPWLHEFAFATARAV
jgi:SAM-dependent methyltransferase